MNYTLSTATTYKSVFFSGPSFSATPSGSTLTGGDDGEEVCCTLDEPASTYYEYNAIDQLTRAYTLDSGGATEQERLYAYNGRGLLTSQTTPEAGTVNYQYNADGLLIQSTDARGVIKTLAYDSLNRLRGVAYNTSADPNVAAMPNACDPFDPMGTATHNTCYYYGTDPATNTNGRLTQVINPTVTESYSYDILGRATQMGQVIDSVPYTLSYAYNLASELTSITYPSGRVVEQDFDLLGRLEAVREGATNYASGFDYSNPAQQLEGFNYGNGVVADFTYTAERLQLDTIKYTKGATKLLDLDYCYRDFDPVAGTCSTTSGANNGQITGIIDGTGTAEAGRTVGYSYDGLGRLAAAETKGSTTFAKWKYDYAYDRYGNRPEQDLVAGSGPETFMAYDVATNRITTAGYAYDVSGNLTDDNVNSYKYDAEGRIMEVNGGTTATYSYDGAGIRVKKDVGGMVAISVYSGTKVIAKYNSGAAKENPNIEYVYLGGQLMATIDTAGSADVVSYHHQDHLSIRVTTDAAGANPVDQWNYPFGEAGGSATDPTNTHFTTYEHDAETSLDYAMFRFDSTRMGRFMTPDPIAGSISDPQSLNRYAYTRNDPINLVDPLGLEHWERCQLWGEWVGSAEDPEWTGTYWWECEPIPHDNLLSKALDCNSTLGKLGVSLGDVLAGLANADITDGMNSDRLVADLYENADSKLLRERRFTYFGDLTVGERLRQPGTVAVSELGGG